MYSIICCSLVSVSNLDLGWHIETVSSVLRACSCILLGQWCIQPSSQSIRVILHLNFSASGSFSQWSALHIGWPKCLSFPASSSLMTALKEFILLGWLVDVLSRDSEGVASQRRGSKRSSSKHQCFLGCVSMHDSGKLHSCSNRYSLTGECLFFNILSHFYHNFFFETIFNFYIRSHNQQCFAVKMEIYHSCHFFISVFQRWWNSVSTIFIIFLLLWLLSHWVCIWALSFLCSSLTKYLLWKFSRREYWVVFHTHSSKGCYESSSELGLPFWSEIFSVRLKKITNFKYNWHFKNYGYYDLHIENVISYNHIDYRSPMDCLYTASHVTFSQHKLMFVEVGAFKHLADC